MFKSVFLKTSDGNCASVADCYCGASLAKNARAERPTKTNKRLLRMLESVIKVVQRTLAYEDLKIRFSHRQDYSKSLNGRFHTNDGLSV